MNIDTSIPLEEYIPFSNHVNDHIVQTRHGNYLTTLQIMGTHFTSLSDEDLGGIALKFTEVLRYYSESHISFYNHSIREDFFNFLKMEPEKKDINNDPNLIHSSVKENKFRENILYFTIVYRPDNRTKKKEITARVHIHKMNKIIEVFSSALSQFKYGLLGRYDRKETIFSSQLSFYQYLITGKIEKVRTTEVPFYEKLDGVNVFFNEGIGNLIGADMKIFFQSIRMENFIDRMTSGLFDVLQHAGIDYVFSQSYTCMGKSGVLNTIQHSERQMQTTGDRIIKHRKELETSRDNIDAKRVSFGYHHYSLIIFSDSIEELNNSFNAVKNDLIKLGITTGLATLTLPTNYFFQLPSTFHLRPK